MKCSFCQGKMQNGAAPFHVDRDGYNLTLGAIPAWICTQCGEAHFEEEEVQAIQNLITLLDQQAKKITLQPTSQMV